MEDKINVEIFGVKGEVPEESGCEGCGGGSCNDVPTMDEETVALQKYFTDKGLDDKVDVTFIDLREEDHEMVSEIKKFLEEGYNLPLVSVGGLMRFYGGIAPEQIIREIERQEKEN